MSSNLHTWESIKANFNGAVLLGNGASIAVNESFKYDRLQGHAVNSDLLKDDVNAIFDFFETGDFELVLHILWQAKNVNKALNINDGQTEAACRHVKECLISAVHTIHPEYGEMNNQLDKIYTFIKEFDLIISLNYDLIIYWALMYGNNVTDHYKIKDCFINAKFEPKWKELQRPGENEIKCPLVFYPHGNLILARNKTESEIKITSNGEGLLNSVIKTWEDEDYVPLFVSEGTSEQKIKAIQKSHYLNTVYQEVLTDLPDNLTIYGWNLNDFDNHILDQISKSNIKRITISAYQQDQAYCARVREKLTEKLSNQCEIFFFDSASPGCWIHQ